MPYSLRSLSPIFLLNHNASCLRFGVFLGLCSYLCYFAFAIVYVFVIRVAFVIVPVSSLYSHHCIKHRARVADGSGKLFRKVAKGS